MPATSALMVLASCGSSFTVNDSCLFRLLEAEKGSYLVGTEAWKKATTDQTTGERLWIDPVVIERGGISIIGEDFGADLSSHNRYLTETCPEVFKRAELPPAE